MLTPIPFGGMKSLEADELVPMSQALVAENCYLDDDTVKPRNGYRALTNAALVGSGTGQGIWRFRPSPSSARLVGAVAGQVFTITDPASETALGTAASVSTPFGASANLSAAQLGRYLFIGTDESVPMQRMDSGYTLTSLGSLGQGTIPTYSLGTLAISKLSGLTPATAGGAGTSVLMTDWVQLTDGAAGDMPLAGTVTYDIGAGSGLNWNAYQWLVVFCSCPTQGSGGGTLEVSLGNTSGVYTSILSMYDTPGGGSPNVAFVNLNSLDSTTRAAVRYLRFGMSGATGPAAVYGYMLVASAPSFGTQQYRVTFYNSTTGQESTPTDTVTVTFASDAVSIPLYHSVYYNKAWKDIGNQSADPNVLSADRCFNKGKGLAIPNRSEFGAVPTFNGTLLGGGGYDKVRLWKLTTTGWRIVREVGTNQSPYSNGTTYSIPDDQGDLTLTHQLYKAGGTPPQCNAMTARAQRLICAYENRVYISSFVPTGLNTDPYPQFPDIPLQDSDGWSFDIAPSKVEQIQCLANGDALYILTNEAAYVMTDVAPNSVPYKVFERGALGRRACCWAESNLFYAGYDGLYMIENRTNAVELSQAIRRQWREWFSPDSNTVVCYQGRKVYVFSGTKYLRYDFVTGRWTRGTVTHTFRHAVIFRDPTGTVQNLWMMDTTRKIMRWQPSDVVGSANAATTDDGTTIPAWTYTTGYEFTPVKTRVRKIYLDATQPLSVQVNVSSVDSGRIQEFKGEHDAFWSPDVIDYKFRLKIVGRSSCQLKRLMWERQGSQQEGANRA